MPSLLLSTWNTRELRPGIGRFRSDVPVHLLPGEIRWLRDERGVSLAIDLRSETEQAAKPCALKNIPGITYESRPVVTGDITPHCPEDVPRSYLSMTGGDLRGTLERIWTHPGGVIWFCNAGKDRTGVVSALLLRRMGASVDEIAADYARSADNLRLMLAEFVARRPDLSLDVVTPREWYIREFLRRAPADL